MADVEILTGTLTSHDITLGGSSVKCGFAQVVIDVNAQPIETTTFCSGSFVEEKKGRKQANVQIIGYQTIHAAWSDPLLYVLDDDPVAFVGLATAGASTSFDLNVFGDTQSYSASFNSGRVISGRSTGAITGVWITT